MPDMILVARDYPWLTVEDGDVGIDMSDTTDAEMDRRMVIAQELRAGRLTLTNGWKPTSVGLSEEREP